MARGGGRRTYVRDSAGRFASTPGGGLGAARKAARSQSGRTSTLAARSSLKRSRAKLAAKDRADETLQGTLSTRAQKGAVTRGNRKLAGAKVAARTKLATDNIKVTGKVKKTPRPNNSAATTRAVTTKKASDNKSLITRKANKKPAKKVKFQMTEADARKLGTLEAGKSILDVIKTDKTLRKLQKINQPKSPVQKLKRSEKLNKAFASGISTAKMAKAPNPEWMPDFAGNRLKEIQGTPNTPFYQYMLFKTGRAQSGPLRPGLGKRLKTMQGVSYEKLPPKVSAASAQNQAKKASPKNMPNSSFRPGEFYRGNFRPRNVAGKPQKSPTTFGTNKDQNIETMINLAKNSKRFSVANLQKNKKSTIASVSFPPPVHTPNFNINTSNRWYKNPAKEQITMRKENHLSTSDPRGVFFHESAHAKYGHTGKQRWPGGRMNPFESITRRVSKYAGVNPNEFVAEVYAGRKTGRKYDHQVMRLFRSYTKSVFGGPDPLRLRNQKPLRRKPKPNP